MLLFELLKELLEEKGIDFEEHGDSVQFSIICGSHRWQAAFTEDSESFLKYYARYPWAVVGKDNEVRVLECLNSLNATLRAGCFMLHEGFPMFRYGVYIFDEFTARESIEDLLITAVAVTEAEWKTVFDSVRLTAEGRDGV